MKTYGELEGEFHLFLISVIDWNECSVSRPNSFTSWEESRDIHLIWWCVCLKSNLDVVDGRRICLPARNEILIFRFSVDSLVFTINYLSGLHFGKIHFNIILSSTRTSLKVSICFRISDSTRFAYLTQMPYAPRASSLWFDSIRCREKILEFFNLQNFPTFLCGLTPQARIHIISVVNTYKWPQRRHPYFYISRLANRIKRDKLWAIRYGSYLRPTMMFIRCPEFKCDMELQYLISQFSVVKWLHCLHLNLINILVNVSSADKTRASIKFFLKQEWIKSCKLIILSARNNTRLSMSGWEGIWIQYTILVIVNRITFLFLSQFYELKRFLFSVSKRMYVLKRILKAWQALK